MLALTSLAFLLRISTVKSSKRISTFFLSSIVLIKSAFFFPRSSADFCVSQKTQLMNVDSLLSILYGLESPLPSIVPYPFSLLYYRQIVSCNFKIGFAGWNGFLGVPNCRLHFEEIQTRIIMKLICGNTLICSASRDSRIKTRSFKSLNNKATFLWMSNFTHSYESVIRIYTATTDHPLIIEFLLR